MSVEQKKSTAFLTLILLKMTQFFQCDDMLWAVGDMLLFPRHVGALTEDRGEPGVLDTDDIMMHTLFASPQRQRIGNSGYGGYGIEVLRWK